jgi:hypothetical protein
LRHSQINGRMIEANNAATTIMMLVPPNWDMPKKVAIVLGKEVTVVTIVR